MAIYKDNIIIGPDIDSKALPIPCWLTADADPRPRAVLVTGDGFTQSFLKSMGHDSEIRCSIDDLVPAPKGARYLPFEGDCFESGPFWDQAKWPKTYEFWVNKGKPSGREFFKAIEPCHINPTRKQGAWSFDPSSLNFEIRCYLYHLFRYFDSKFVELCRRTASVDQWDWAPVLQLLISEFSARFISFNYDFFLERFLCDVLRTYCDRRAIVSPVESPVYPVDWRPVDCLLDLKIHGSIKHHIRQLPILPLGANPWLANADFQKNFITGFNTVVGEFNLFPLIPDLVPPGQYGDSYANPWSIVARLSKKELERAQLVIVCGLSGAEPDTAEVKDLFSELKEDSHVVQVGLLANSDDGNQVAKILTSCSLGSYKFFDASELHKIREHLRDKFRLRWV